MAFSADGILALRAPSVNATAIAAGGGGIQVSKGIYKGEDSIGFVTPAAGMAASLDVNFVTLKYRGSSASDTPVKFTAGGSYDFHEILGGRVTLGCAPPATFQLIVDGGVGTGTAWHIVSVDGVIK